MQLPFSPVEAVQCFAKALEARDPSAAMVASTKEGFTPGPMEGPGAYFHRLTKSGVSLEIMEPQVRIAGDRAVVPAAVLKDGTRTFPLFFFVEQKIGNWRIAGVSRSPAYAKKVMAGEAPALFDVTKLAQSTAVIPWAESLIAYLDDDDAPGDDEEGVPDMISRWRTFVKAKPGKTFIKRTVQDPWFGRAAVMFTSEITGDDGRVREANMWLVAEPKGDGWVPVWFGHDFEPALLFAKL